jgi:hypothetical protein
MALRDEELSRSWRTVATNRRIKEVGAAHAARQAGWLAWNWHEFRYNSRVVFQHQPNPTGVRVLNAAMTPAI